MDNQVSGVLCPPVSPYSYIFHSLITSVNRLYRHEQLLWALLNHCVKAELVVIKELLDSVSGPAACGRNEILFSWEYVWNRGQPSTWVLLLELAIREPVFCLQVEDTCTGYHQAERALYSLDSEGIRWFLMFVYLHGEYSHNVDHICEPKWRGGTETFKMFFAIQLLLNKCHFMD